MTDVSLIEKVKTHLSKLSADANVSVRFEWSFWADSPTSSWRTGTERFSINLEGYKETKVLTFTELLELTADDLRPKAEVKPEESEL